MTTTVERLREAGLVSSLDVRAARTWARMAGEADEEVVAAAALASRAVVEGHVCLDLHRVADTPPIGPHRESAEAPPPIDWPQTDAWCARLRESPLVHASAEARTAAPDALRPLVLDAEGRLYLRRYWDHQSALAAAIRARLVDGGAEAVDDTVLADGLDRLFQSGGGSAGDGDEATRDLQRVAAEGAVRSRFFVVSGGPGTGKTSTVVRILALLVEQAFARGEPAPRIELLAPTGKAAAHLKASVGRSVDALDCPPGVRAAIPRDARTVHRALGARGRPTAFAHDAGSPLPVDAVVVDEASMVDLALMARLVTALPPHARLILLGDRDQLASVEAGAVLGDIAGGGEPAPAVDAARREAVSRPVVHLVRSHRFETAGDLGALVGAVHAGDADRTLALLDDPDRPALARIEPGDHEALVEALRVGYEAYAAARSATDRLTALDRFRVLCAHRHGPFGVSEHNALVESLLAARGAIEPRPGAYAGRPVLITRNDPSAGLYNGDVGVMGRAPGRAGLRVLFRAADGGDRWLSPLRIGAAETVFAMSVHKAQGSELDAVGVVLPDVDSPVVTRELLYTAVSRARRAVWIRATPETIREALGRRVERASGLRDAIWGPGPTLRRDGSSTRR